MYMYLKFNIPVFGYQFQKSLIFDLILTQCKTKTITRLDDRNRQKKLILGFNLQLINYDKNRL